MKVPLAQIDALTLVVPSAPLPSAAILDNGSYQWSNCLAACRAGLAMCFFRCISIFLVYKFFWINHVCTL